MAMTVGDKRKSLNPDFSVIIAIILIFLGLSPALYTYSITAINHNTVWNLMCAERLLTMDVPFHQLCYDTNPPLSHLMHIPMVLWMWALPFAHYVNFYILVYLCLFLSLLVTYLFLKKIEELDNQDRLFFMLGLSIGLIVITNTVFFADREHFLAMIVVPFVLCQLCITRKITISPWLKYPILIVGAILLLVKPFFGLLPLSLFVHRYWKQRRLNIIHNPDFVILTLASLLYLLIVFIFFMDFVKILLPDIVSLYLPNNSPRDTFETIAVYIVPMILILSTFSLRKRLNSRDYFILSFLGLSALCLVPHAIQMKDFFYHLLPMFSFYCPALCLLISTPLKYGIWRKHTVIKSSIQSVLIIFVFAFAYFSHPFLYKYPKHSTYQNSKILQYINSYCPKPCSIFMTNEDMGIINQITFYGDITYASRFPSLWFVPAFNGYDRLPKHVYANTDYYRERFSDFILDDLTFYKPDLMLIFNELGTYNQEVQSKRVSPLNRYFDLFDFMSKNTRAKSILKNYQYIGELTENRGLYYRGAALEDDFDIQWSVYKRKPNTDNIKD